MDRFGPEKPEFKSPLTDKAHCDLGPTAPDLVSTYLLQPKYNFKIYIYIYLYIWILTITLPHQYKNEHMCIEIFGNPTRNKATS